jgi:SAM-dependent methyltransferase
LILPVLPDENIYGHTKKLQFILDELDRSLAENGGRISVLDFGCGNGSAVSQYLLRPGIDYIGVDIHGPSLEYAKQHFGSESARFLDHIPEGSLFDVIVYSDNLEHLDVPDEFLRAHSAFLRPGGKIIGAIPNGYGLFEMENRVSRILHLAQFHRFLSGVKQRLHGGNHVALGGDLPYNHDSGHLQFFTKSSLQKVLGDAGFELDRFQNGIFLGAPYSELLLSGKRFNRFNTRAAEHVPYWAASTWYFTARRTDHLRQQNGKGGPAK